MRKSSSRTMPALVEMRRKAEWAGPESTTRIAPPLRGMPLTIGATFHCWDIMPYIRRNLEIYSYLITSSAINQSMIPASGKIFRQSGSYKKEGRPLLGPPHGYLNIPAPPPFRMDASCRSAPQWRTLPGPDPSAWADGCQCRTPSTCSGHSPERWRTAPQWGYGPAPG